MEPHLLLGGKARQSQKAVLMELLHLLLGQAAAEAAGECAGVCCRCCKPDTLPYGLCRLLGTRNLLSLVGWLLMLTQAVCEGTHGARDKAHCRR